jgi:hypothetical protein
MLWCALYTVQHKKIIAAVATITCYIYDVYIYSNMISLNNNFSQVWHIIYFYNEAKKTKKKLMIIPKKKINWHYSWKLGRTTGPMRGMLCELIQSFEELFLIFSLWRPVVTLNEVKSGSSNALSTLLLCIRKKRFGTRFELKNHRVNSKRIITSIYWKIKHLYLTRNYKKLLPKDWINIQYTSS